MLHQIGKELLEAELPVCIRLLGLRVSSLKDLRAPEHGIKRVRTLLINTKIIYKQRFSFSNPPRRIPDLPNVGNSMMEQLPLRTVQNRM